jgi:hypothetical protein
MSTWRALATRTTVAGRCMNRGTADCRCMQIIEKHVLSCAIHECRGRSPRNVLEKFQHCFGRGKFLLSVVGPEARIQQTPAHRLQNGEGWGVSDRRCALAFRAQCHEDLRARLLSIPGVHHTMYMRLILFLKSTMVTDPSKNWDGRCTSGFR